MLGVDRRGLVPLLTQLGCNWTAIGGFGAVHLNFKLGGTGIKKTLHFGEMHLIADMLRIFVPRSSRKSGHRSVEDALNTPEDSRLILRHDFYLN